VCGSNDGGVRVTRQKTDRSFGSTTRIARSTPSTACRQRRVDQRSRSDRGRRNGVHPIPATARSADDRGNVLLAFGYSRKCFNVTNATTKARKHEEEWFFVSRVFVVALIPDGHVGQPLRFLRVMTVAEPLEVRRRPRIPPSPRTRCLTSPKSRASADMFCPPACTRPGLKDDGERLSPAARLASSVPSATGARR